jgi:pyruvate ferredoxin oxidoreductase gamma subunit/2-oxoisovalerate ferredoxin oxidoreductase gamma subunit
VRFSTGRVFTVDATGIAMEAFGRDIPSTIMLGVVAKATGLVRLESLSHLVSEKLGEKLRPVVVEANVRSLQKAYEVCQEG